MLKRAFVYWRNVDDGIGARIETEVRAKTGEPDPAADEQGHPVHTCMQEKA